MRHRYCAILVIFGFALAVTSCESWKWNQKPEGDELVMPLQTGSTIQRRITVPGISEESPKKSKKKKESKEKKDSEKKKKEAKKRDDAKKREDAKKKKESKKGATTPTPAPARPKHRPEPEPEETPSAPDRLR